MKHRRIGAAIALLLTAAPAAAGWQRVGEGDCPGREVIGSAGEMPDEDLCTPTLAGKTALCFTQVCYPGCQYIDVPTRDCHGVSELAQVYTCVPNIGANPDQ